KRIAQFTYQVFFHRQTSDGVRKESIGQSLWQTDRSRFTSYVTRQIKHTLAHSTGRFYSDHLLYFPGRSFLTTAAVDKESSCDGSLSTFVYVNPNVLYTSRCTVHSYDTMHSFQSSSIKVGSFGHLFDPSDRSIMVVHRDIFDFRFFFTSDVPVIKIQFFR